MKKVLIVILVIALLSGAAFAVFLTLDKQQSKTDDDSSSSQYLAVSSSLEEPEEELSDIQKTESEYFKITQPQTKSFTTKNSSVTFKGNTNITTGVTLNGKQIKIPKDIDGSFTVTEKLKYGKNKFVFKAGKFETVYNITRKYEIITDYSPKTEQTYSAGATFSVSVTAKKGATVTATFNNKKLTLTKAETKKDGFAVFSGNFTLPKGHFKDLNLGVVEFKAVYKKYSDTATSKNIICQKEKGVVSYDADATPTGGNYINVGSGVITEIVGFQAETFDGKGNMDISKPYYTHLPQGTVDYGSPETLEIINESDDKLELITLRCGKKVYKYRYEKPPYKKVAVAKQYAGTLPDHNELSVAGLYETTTHTRLILNTLWKAPFDFQLKDQKYNSDYTVSNVTFNYVDITFCYATKFEGEINIPATNPLFKSAKLIKNKSDYTLRLYLKKQGGFYGWDSYYNSQNQLCFEFLKPAKIKSAKNTYGVNLNGARILIDVGHGGSDSGATNLGGRKNREAVRNLVLAKKIAKELHSIGATVYLTRSDDSTSSNIQKSTMFKNLKPDYCLAIHHDSDRSSSANGFGSYYYYPFSKNAAQYVLNHSFNTGLYKRKTFKWHFYFMSRVSVCPVVLTENGFMSNQHDYNNIKDDAANTQKAIALTRGIVEYFKSIQ